MKRALIALLLTGCAGRAPVPVNDAPPDVSVGVGGSDYVPFDPSVPTRWVQDHQEQFGYGGVNSIENVWRRHADTRGGGWFDSRLYRVQTRDRGLLNIMTEERADGGERVTMAYTGSIPTDDLVIICEGATC